MHFWKWLQVTPTRKLWILVTILLGIVIIMALNSCGLMRGFVSGVGVDPDSAGKGMQGASGLLPAPFDILLYMLGGSLLDRGGTHVARKAKKRKQEKGYYFVKMPFIKDGKKS